MTNKPPYRFTSDDFISFYGEDTRQAIVRIANEKLAEWEAGSDKVWGKPGVFPWEASDEDEHIKTASFIAALNPKVVLELIAEVRSLRFSIEQKAGEIGRAEHQCGDENRSLKQKLEVARIALENLPWRPQK